MNKVLIQLWEVSYPDNKIESDGGSLHVDLESRNTFIDQNSEPTERFVGIPTEVEVNENIFNSLMERKTIRLSEIELNNLIGLKDIIPV